MPLNDQNNPTHTNMTALDTKEFVVKASIAYVIMGTIGILMMMYGHRTFTSAMAFPLDKIAAARLVTISVLGGVLLMILSFFFEDWFESFRSLKEAMSLVLGRLTIPQIFVVTVSTAFGEELLFRGGLQPYLGLAIASLLFGLIHIGPGGFLNPWSLWAGIAGLLLGWIFIETGNLWPCILAHFAVNLVSILGLRRRFIKMTVKETPTVKSTP